MKKLPWAGLVVQILMTITIVLLAILGKPIPDFLMAILIGGMLICVVSSISRQYIEINRAIDRVVFKERH